MSSVVSRRTFLKGGMAAAILTASGSTARAAITDGKTQIATLVDISKCIGCEACVDACGEVNADKYPDPEKPYPKMFPPRVKVSDWSDKQDVTDRLTPYNWLFYSACGAYLPGKGIRIDDSATLYALRQSALCQALPLGIRQTGRKRYFPNRSGYLSGWIQMPIGLPMAYSPATNRGRSLSGSFATIRRQWCHVQM